MGMFDSINGEQVKCFYVPIYDGCETNENIWHSGGRARIFKEKDIVPSQTFWYRYSDNFMILDYMYSGVNPLIHIIRNSKVEKTIRLDKLTPIDFIGNEKVLNYYGEELKIYNIEDIAKFIDDKNELEGFSEYKRSTNDLYADNLIRRNNDIEHLKKDPINALFLVSELDRESITKILEGIPINGIEVDDSNSIDLISRYKEDLVSNHKDNLFENKEILNQMRDIVLKRLEDEFHIINDESEKNNIDIEKEIRDLEEIHRNKWFVDRFKDEMKFGEYLECYRYLTSSKNSVYASEDTKSRYEDCILKFSNFIRENNNILERYLIWSSFDKETQDIIREIVKEILNFSQEKDRIS